MKNKTSTPIYLIVLVFLASVFLAACGGGGDDGAGPDDDSAHGHFSAGGGPLGQLDGVLHVWIWHLAGSGSLRDQSISCFDGIKTTLYLSIFSALSGWPPTPPPRSIKTEPLCHAEPG